GRRRSRRQRGRLPHATRRRSRSRRATGCPRVLPAPGSRALAGDGKSAGASRAGERVPPAGTRARCTLHDLRPDVVALDLDGAGADAEAPDVAVRALDGELAAVPVSAEQLDRLVAHELGG